MNDSVTFSFISEWTQKEMVDESAEKVTIIYLHSRHSSRTNQVLNISRTPLRRPRVWKMEAYWIFGCKEAILCVTGNNTGEAR